MPVLKRCCCCVPLREGGMVLGILSLIGSALQVAIFAFMLAKSFIDEEKYREVLGSDIPELNNLQAQYSLLLGITLILCVCAALLIYGASKGRHLFLLPHLIVQGLGSAGMIVEFLCGVFKGPMEEMEGSWAFVVIIILAVCGINVYLWLCVFSLYQKLKAEKLPNAEDPVQKDYPPTVRFVAMK